MSEAAGHGGMMQTVIDQAVHPIQVDGFKRMSPAKKLQMVAELYEAGIRLRIAGLRMTYPEKSVQELEREARRSLLYAGT